MKKIQILGMKKNLQKVLALLQEKGVMQIDEVKGEDEETLELEDHDTDYQIAQLDFAIKLLKDHAKARPIWAGKPTLTLESALGTLKSFNYEETVKKCQDLEEKFVADQNEKAANQAEKALLENWTYLSFNLDTPRTTETTRIFTGAVLTAEYENFKTAIKELSELSGVEKSGENGLATNLVVVISKKHLDEAKALLGKFKFQEVELPSHDMDVKTRITEIDKRAKELDERLEKHEVKFKQLAKNYENLQIVHDVLVWKKDNHDVHEKLRGTIYSFIISGWIAKQDLEKIEAKLTEAAEHILIRPITPEKGEEAPIKLRNNPVSWPFESVTRLYGFPLANEVDPTPFLASFFIIFFALCLTDAGYGLSLFVIMFTMLKFFKLPKESKRLIKLLMWGGLVTMVTGYFFGGYFGLTPEQAPAFMVGEDGNFKGQLINAAAGTGPLTFLILALVLGVVHVLFGKVVDFYWKMHQKEYLDALLDSFLWIYYILAILAWGLSKLGTVVPAEWANILFWCVIGGTAAMVLTQGRKQDGIAKKVGIGVLSLYGLVGYLGDVLSYSRIMALGLGTGIIAFAMNTIAGLAYEMIPYIGFIFAGFVLLLGHVMNLVLSALGAFIHSARLQFVEFFSKFMEGGGTEFKPFKRNCKYIVIT